MPSFFELTIFISGPKTLLPALVQSYLQALEHLDLRDEAVTAWLAALDWEPDEETLGSTFEPIDLPHAPIPLQVTPIVECYGPAAPGEDSWYRLGLLFDSEQIEASADELVWKLLPGPARTIWCSLHRFGLAFPARAIFFVHEAWSLDLLESFMTGQGNPWRFELALIPPALLALWLPLPSSYESLPGPDGVAVAKSESWQVLPWLAEVTP
jgi:hypothetical protein